MTWAAYCRHREEIAGILDERKWPLDWLDTQVWTGAIRTLASDTAIIGFEFKHYPGGARELHGMFAAGDMESILLLIDDAVAVARASLCDMASIESRPSWAKILKPRGFAVDQVRIVKELRDGA